MLEKFNHLSFVIGVFFVLVSLVLIGEYFFPIDLPKNINLYTGIGMLIFGLLMIRSKA
jgi:hypothetical protein